MIRMHIRLGLVLTLVTGLLWVSCSRNPLANETGTAVARACRWLANQQGSDGAISEPTKLLNFDVWETANALTALLRCGTAVDQAVINKGFEFLDANWIDQGGLPESSGRRISPFKSHCVETTSTAMRAYVAGRKRAQAEKLRDFLFSVQEPDGGWKIGYPEAKTFPNGEALEVYPSVTGFALTSIAAVPSQSQRPNVERGLMWLTARQSANGDWGAFPDYLGIP